MSAATMTAPERWREMMREWNWESRPELDDVFSIEHAGVRWLLASNGYEFVAEPSDRAAKPFTDAKAWDGVPYRDRVVPLLEQPEPALRIARSTLSAWAGAPLWPYRCRVCDGSGEAPCGDACPEWCDTEHACPSCGGWGATGEGVVYGRIGAMLVDRSKVARVLSLLEGETIGVYVRGNVGHVESLLYLAGESGVIARVAGLQRIEGFTPPEVEIPEFLLPEPAEAVHA